jgi:hypothetical protein
MRFVIGLLAGVAAAALAITPALADKEKAKLTIKYKNDPPAVGFGGKVKVGSDAELTCALNRLVTIYRVASGHDPKVGSTNAGGGGDWFLSTYDPVEPTPAGKYYAKVKKTKVGPTTCAAAKSKKVTVKAN